jgi:hypothetical protein
MDSSHTKTTVAAGPEVKVVSQENTLERDKAAFLYAARVYVRRSCPTLRMFRECQVDMTSDTVYLTLYYTGDKLNDYHPGSEGTPREKGARSKVAFIAYTPGSSYFKLCYRTDLAHREANVQVHFQ